MSIANPTVRPPGESRDLPPETVADTVRGGTSRVSGPWQRVVAGGGVAWQVINRTFDDGFIHAGNLAYLSLTTLFPIFVIIAAIAGALGRTEDGLEALNVFMASVPPEVARAVAEPIRGLITQQTGGLLTFGILVGLWSSASFVDTIRDIIRRAYGVTGGSIWKQRLASLGAIIAAVLLLLIAFALQFILVGVEQFVTRLLPLAGEIAAYAGFGRIAPAII